jgi:hypothetical protein
MTSNSGQQERLEPAFHPRRTLKDCRNSRLSWPEHLAVAQVPELPDGKELSIERV